MTGLFYDSKIDIFVPLNTTPLSETVSYRRGTSGIFAFGGFQLPGTNSGRGWEEIVVGKLVTRPLLI